ncbi:glycosyltransferase family 9 protein [Mucilaginibacter phyllosphaerae]|uniref:ADP-heptose:LPS heptosyltransferase n=1 Tax=Mucilaginibacter phyllosphaerae TaxID=1812349 RepID=A0A4Y8AIL9_9SPHI|nr:glycosyltransferase family 9 protein [Mucilaginibacter phyllosphaerae]MBB3968059.1 ADP-heptose:LPS heptosyltransferase [Mucilaginibacter phyllosphaerae]TEW68918.1 glycosyltransferase family 9 protein [Mucilaginibacter phyllosphaerae]GGH01497.1 LPS biosynthesis-related glycosyltransferase [Mucilaginibacter phyllosphaerae]
MKLPAHQIKKIAVFRALQLGDMLCAVPAFKALRHACPNAQITLIGLPWAKTFTDRFSAYFDGFVSFPGYPGLPEQELDPAAFTAFLGNVQAMQFDLAIQMQGNGSVVNPMVELFGAKFTAGYATEGHYAPDNGLFMPYPDYGHEIDRHLALMEFLGMPSQGSDLEYPLTTADYDALDALNLGIAPQRYICIHPGSRGGWRQWPVKYFAALADYCVEQGYKAVLTGTQNEAGIIDAVIGHMRYECINAAGKTSMGAVGALIKNAAMLISNCTGVSHIASAFKTPSIVISMDGEPQRWGPLDKRVHRTINWLQSPDFHSVFRETVELVSLAS